MTEKLYYKYWGKAKSDNDSGVGYHLLPYHCLDVAVVGCVLLEQHPFLANRFEQLFNIPKTILFPWLKLLFALHDCGKFVESFHPTPVGMNRTSKQTTRVEYNCLNIFSRCFTPCHQQQRKASKRQKL